MAEGKIGCPKKRFHQNMVSKKVSKHLWDYSLVHQSGILSSSIRGKMGKIAIEEVISQTQEI